VRGNLNGQIGGSGDPTVTYCNVEGNFPGIGNIDANPLFADPNFGDFHLTWDSPCRNTGDNSSVGPESLYDFEGDPRIADTTVDMGADEFFTHLYCIKDIVPGDSVDI